MAWRADTGLEMRAEGSWGLKTRSRILKAGSLCAQTEVFLPSSEQHPGNAERSDGVRLVEALSGRHGFGGD